jgi:hypothetical protein
MTLPICQAIEDIRWYRAHAALIFPEGTTFGYKSGRKCTNKELRRVIGRLRLYIDNTSIKYGYVREKHAAYIVSQAKSKVIINAPQVLGALIKRLYPENCNCQYKVEDSNLSSFIVAFGNTRKIPNHSVEKGVAMAALAKATEEMKYCRQSK